MIRAAELKDKEATASGEAEAAGDEAAAAAAAGGAAADAEEKAEEEFRKLEKELRDFSLGSGASAHGVSTARRDKKGVTEMKGFEKMKPYAGDATQWKDWRFKMTTWLAQTNASFETLMSKLDQSELEPKEPEEGQNMTARPKELTTEEEWCSEQLYQLLVQKCEAPSLAIVRRTRREGREA